MLVEPVIDPRLAGAPIVTVTAVLGLSQAVFPLPTVQET
jgi:hypothetical protein